MTASWGRTRLRYRNMAVVEPQRWQPIETAPKNTPVLVSVTVRDDTPVVGEAWWDARHDEPDYGWWWAGDDYTDSHTSRIFPTHWMPLPAHPGEEP